MATVSVSGFQGLNREWRVKTNGLDSTWNVIITVAEARGLNGLGNHGLNDCFVKVTLSTDPDDDTSVSRVHDKTSMPFFNHVFKLTFSGQPAAFFSSFVQVEVMHNREMFGVKSPKLVGLLQIGMLDVFHMQDHKLPMQWFPIVDLNSEEPAIPTGFIRMNVIVNSIGESGGVQSDVPEAERGQTELMIIPRMHACCTSTGAYNLIFRIYQARDLRKMDGWGADAFIKVSCGSGEMRTDTRNGTVNPVWNQQLQIPIYEPLFREMICVEVWHENGLAGNTLMCGLKWTWKDLNSDQDYFKQERWYDMYELPDDNLGNKVLKSSVVRWVVRRAPGAVRQLVSSARGRYQEPSVYCGRVLLSVAIEDRKGAKSKPPSLAQTDLKPKDCKFFQDVLQKAYFRLQIFFAQGLAAAAGLESTVQVELQIGQRSVASKAVSVSADGLFEWYEAIELEMDFLYDDARWPWSQQAYEAGLVPSVLIDEGMPDAWIKVYRCNTVGYHLHRLVNETTRRLIGFKRCSVRELLGLGVSDRLGPDGQPGGGMESVEGHRNEEGIMQPDEMRRDKRNLILNKKDSSQPAFFLKDADELPAEFDPRRFGKTKCSLALPAWPAPRAEGGGPDTVSVFPAFDDGRGNTNNMDPYIGVQSLELDRDGTCALEDSDYPGRVWVSCKCYIPSRANCESAVKGPPLLSPFTKYNAVPIPRPSQMDKCIQTFCLRCHVYQARDLPASSAVGIANAYVEVRLGHRKARTHVVHGSNSPTWDTTLYGGELNNIELPCLGWPGRNFDCSIEQELDFDECLVRISYDVNADPGDEFRKEIWLQNQAMLRFAPWIEIRVTDKGDLLLGRCFVDPSTCLSTQQDPEWRSLFKGNPAQGEGQLLVALQLLHKADPLQMLPPAELSPIRTKDAEDCLSDRTRVGRSVLAGPDSLTQEVFMRECRIQVQVLGLRNVDPVLGLKKPSVAVFIQTTDQWDADKKFSCLFTQAKSSVDPNIPPNNQNFMETLELKVFLPDEKEYAPALEFVVLDEPSGLIRYIEGDSRAAVAWGTLSMADFHPQGTEAADGDAAVDEEEAEKDVALRNKLLAQERRKNFLRMLDNMMLRKMIQPGHLKTLKASFERNDPELLDVFQMYLDAPSENEFLMRSEWHLLDPDGKRAAALSSADVKGEGAETVEESSKDVAVREENEDPAGDGNEGSTLNLLGTAGRTKSIARRGSQGGPGGAAPLNKVKSMAALSQPLAQTLPLENADAGPHIEGEQDADNPNNPRGAAGGDPAAAAAAEGVGDAGPDGNEAGESGPVGRADPVDPQDDIDADRQEEIDTPDGKPNAEWLIFRKNRLYTQPLEDTADWRHRLQDAFHEVPLYRGRWTDYKRKDAGRVGIIKCLVKVFRKEDEDDKGKSKVAEGTREATFFEVLARDPSVSKGIEKFRPYRMNNIYELYPESVLDVRLYCLKAVQVTPGGLGRRNADGSPFWSHYLQATLGQMNLESDVDPNLNPSFFHTFVFRGVVLPGPSQLVVALRDGELKEGKVDNSQLIGETTIDLEDRWFCPDWRDLLYKPREVRDLYNEAAQPGISQGKIIVVLDMVDEVRAEDMPPMDIQVLGKTLPMEMRIIVWDTRDTAGKDGYTSDVYVRAELLGVGEPKETDVHYGVKLKAFGMFNYRLKWRCKYPTEGVAYLLRIGLWDYNLMTSHQCIAEGVLPLRPLFQECFEKNLGKTSPDDMEVISLPAVDDPDGAGAGGTTTDEEGAKYPFRWFTLVHPSHGFNPEKDAQGKLKITIQVQPRARARANPAGSKRNGPAKLPEPDRPPQPANPIMESEKCKAYIVYSIKECFARCRVPCLCCCCVLIVAAIVAAVVGVKMALA